ncbi:DUF4825 domain-containing protein [Clostridium estertheticum]|uniref:DUF4825 domain-containing protein n=1 Tax=Clostridium estertheticum TaxID=238834 RepID=A0AA47EJP8_9CLOT|nr:DUF4825 domain-containing protein [Clostridium estertheticum]MBU3153745.1 DUF4825 domain-containing protein [Clostridium estertheticum]MBU3200227.1 DUF4825 domain-containing protein [Clostridium estertheticum]WAG61468.1 DUF4825 domain-containing protein [Clostridium estertheticum]WAG64402.1 DUF4825 domain-containing protein [Clostridium estertheticum]
MKTRNNIIIGLAIMGIVLFGLVQFIVIPKNNQKNSQYMVQQRNPITHDINNVLKYRNEYMGNSSNIINLFHKLPLSNIKMSFELFPNKLTAEVNYKDTIANINENKVNKALIYNSTVAFALIDNLQVINYNFTGSAYKVSRLDVEKWYGRDLPGLLKKEEWKNKVQDKLEDNKYVNDCIKAVLMKK